MDDKETILKFLEQMSTQDNRATAFPIYYVIRSARWVPMDRDCSCSDDGGKGERDVFVAIDDSTDVITEDEYQQLPDEAGDEDELAKENYEPKKERRIWDEHCMFLTETDAERHLKLNDYHYSKDAHTFVKCAWRAPELREFLLALFRHFGVAPRKDPGTM